MRARTSRRIPAMIAVALAAFATAGCAWIVGVSDDVSLTGPDASGYDAQLPARDANDDGPLPADGANDRAAIDAPYEDARDAAAPLDDADADGALDAGHDAHDG